MRSRFAPGAQADVARTLAVMTVSGLVGLAGPGVAAAVPGDGHNETGAHLYTPPDPAVTGGLRGTVAAGVRLEAVVVVDAFDWTRVYLATLAADGRTFSLAGLPPSKYDLVLVCADRVYEGLALARETGDLAAEDLAGIGRAVDGSAPFFDGKRIDRCTGLGGRDGDVLALVQAIRTDKGGTKAGAQPRSLRLSWVKNAGPAWEIVNNRELLRQDVPAGGHRGYLEHEYRPHLGGIRVTDGVKDLGRVALAAAATP